MRRQFNGAVIVGATTVYKRLGAASSLGVVMHELAHAFGLSHSLDSSRDVMGPGPDDKVDYSDREKLVMRLMLQRPPGNQFPDNDRSVANALGRSRVEQIRCE